MSDIAFIGDRDTVWPFKALGCDVFFAEGPESAPGLIADAVKREFKIIFVTEEVRESAQEKIDAYAEQATPTFTVIPSVKGSRGVAMQIIRESVRKAMGAEFI